MIALGGVLLLVALGLSWLLRNQQVDNAPGILGLALIVFLTAVSYELIMRPIRGRRRRKMCAHDWRAASAGKRWRCPWCGAEVDDIGDWS